MKIVSFTLLKVLFSALQMYFSYWAWTSFEYFTIISATFWVLASLSLQSSKYFFSSNALIKSSKPFLIFFSQTFAYSSPFPSSLLDLSLSWNLVRSFFNCSISVYLEDTSEATFHATFENSGCWITSSLTSSFSFCVAFSTLLVSWSFFSRSELG